jgi:general secretion pathway protein D
MKVIHLLLLAALASSGSILFARQSSNAAANTTSNAPVTTNAVPAAQPAAPPAGEQTPAPAATTAASAAGEIPQPPASDSGAPGSAGPSPDAQPLATTNAPDKPAEDSTSATMVASNGTNGLHLNFRNAPLERVLNYLSEAAGFVIVLEARPRGTVDIMSSSPVTREEAVSLLDQQLRKNGYAAIRKGRTLTIVPRDEAKIHAIPVRVGADPASIPETDEIVTQIIPVRYVEVGQLVKDLQPLVSTQTTMTANESGNEIVITDSSANIHKVAEIVKAIDAGAEDVTVVRVFRLNYADPTELSDLLVNLFPDDSRSGGSSSPVQFGGFGGLRSFFRGGGGGGGPGGGGAAGGGSNNQNQRIKKRARVVAVPDPRTSSVAVSAARDLMDQIEGVVTELDSNPAKVKKVKVFKVENADAQQVMQLLQDTFTGTGQSSQRTANQNSALTTRGSQQSTSQGATGTRTGGSSRGGGASGSFGP